MADSMDIDWVVKWDSLKAVLSECLMVDYLEPTKVVRKEIALVVHLDIWKVAQKVLKMVC